MATRRVTAEVGLIVLRIGVHIDATVPVVSAGIGSTGRQLTTISGLFDSVTNAALTMRRDGGNSAMSNPCCRGHICGAIGRIRVTGGTIESQVSSFGMAFATTDPVAANTIQLCAMAQGASLLNIGCGVVKNIIFRASPNSWVRKVCAMTGLAARATLAFDTNIKAGITSRPAGRII